MIANGTGERTRSLARSLTNGVDADCFEHLEFGDGLELRAAHLDVDALPQTGRQPEARRNLAAGRPKRRRVHLVGCEVPGTEPGRRDSDALATLVLVECDNISFFQNISFVCIIF